MVIIRQVTGFYTKNNMNPQSLNQLPPPPKGQTGVTLDQFKHLPPPPQGQQGMTLDQVKGNGQNQSSTPLLSQPSGGSFLSNLSTAGKDLSTGFVKGALGGTRAVAQGLQGMGQRILASFQSGGNTFPNDPTRQAQYDKNLSNIQQNTGFKSLNPGTPESNSVDQALTPNTTGEKMGSGIETLGELGTGLSGGTTEAIISKGKGLLKGAIDAYTAAKEAKGTADATAKVGEMITPKATPKEAKLAMDQGRLVKGDKPTMFKAGTEDKILPTAKQQSATKTIIEKIPNADKMSPTELYTAVDNNISQTAQRLKPIMEATPIKPETLDKLNTDWSTLKKEQLANAPATEEANVAKRQNQFEEFLKKSGSDNQNDLWETRKSYDDSIKPNVKKANEMSPESLQMQKQEWLDNRAVLNSAIHDTSSTMGKMSQKAFSDMSNLYEAKSNLLTKAKVETKIQPSKINQFIQRHPVVSGAIGGGTIYGAAKKVGVPLP